MCKLSRLKKYPSPAMTQRLLRFFNPQAERWPVVPLTAEEQEKLRRFLENASYVAESSQEQQYVSFDADLQRWALQAINGTLHQRPGIYVNPNGSHYAVGNYYYRIWQRLYVIDKRTV